MNTYLKLIACLMCAACTQAEITTPPVAITPKNPSSAVGVDVYAGDRSRGNPVPEFRGQEIAQVRTFGQGETGRTELSGVACTLDSGLYTASFVTPANIVVPDYGQNSPALFVRCINGQSSGSTTVNTLNFTAQQRQSASFGTGLLGAIIIGAVAVAQTDNEKDEFKYPLIVVNLSQ